MFGKVMSISDQLMWRILELLSLVKTVKDLSQMQAQASAGTVNLREFKAEPAKKIVTRFHSHAVAKTAQESFDCRFGHGQVPNEIQEARVDSNGAKPVALTNLLQKSQPTKVHRRRIDC